MWHIVTIGSIFSNIMKKSLVRFGITLLFAFVALAFVANPSRYTKVFLDGITVWAHNVLPVLFPFALLSTIYAGGVSANRFSLSKSLFGISCDNVWFVSFLCGYPAGARAISQQDIDDKTAVAVCSFCSTPNPIFVLATVGTLLDNITATIIVCIAQAVAMILNGLLYTAGKSYNFNNKLEAFVGTDFGTTLTNSILSVLSVGGLIALFFVLTEMIQGVLPPSISQQPTVFFAIGLLEMTSGIIKVAQSCNIFVATICTSALLSFGGLCVTLQCFAFLSQKGVKLTQLLKTKCTQSAFATLIAFVLAKIFL